MRLLVSVRSPDEVAAAAAGGADIIDAKEPSAGALGAVTIETFRAIRRAAGPRVVSAALGDPAGEDEAERLASSYGAAGATFVKIGLAATASVEHAGRLVSAARRGAAVVAVAYADHDRAGSLHPMAVMEAAVHGGASGVLIDTALKTGPGLTRLVTPAALAAWAAAVQRAGLFFAAAGQLARTDIAAVCRAGVDVVGVRGAVCRGGRTGRVARALVRALADQVSAAAADQARAAADTAAATARGSSAGTIAHARSAGHAVEK